MDSDAPVPGWNAHRRPQDPLRPPSYRFESVPKCDRRLRNSVLMEVTDREAFKECMAELLLLGREALRRKQASPGQSKPLSLEYLADRLDVDDPCRGYLVRSAKGQLQGFISITTFTNWQAHMRWDSLHELSFYYDESDDEDDDEEDKRATPSISSPSPRSPSRIRRGPRKERIVDRDGQLARELQATVRLGDPYQEGIVWPRIAEISLLGALGCGKALVQLAIEDLEFQKASGTANYDYAALQATDNSIPFYESLGFVRVGAVTLDPPKQASHLDDFSDGTVAQDDSASSTCSSSDGAISAEPLPPSSPAKLDALALPPNLVAGPLTSYTVGKKGDILGDIAKREKVNVWDLVFLNKELYPELSPRSGLMKGTLLHFPLSVNDMDNNLASSEKTQKRTVTKWFVAKENDTPRKIAKQFELSCKALVKANALRLPGLQATSRLKEGTRVKVSNLDQQDDSCSPYCHWSFPEDTHVEGGEPSYMMVYKLDRKTSRRSRRTVRESLQTPVVPYEPAKLLLEAPPKTKTKKVPVKLPPPPKKPPSAMGAMDIFKEHYGDLHPELQGNHAALEKEWRTLPKAKQERYQMVAVEGRKHLQQSLNDYEVEYSLWEEECAHLRAKPPMTVLEKEATLFNKVVRLREDALEGHDYKYWFVLTYIPDLKWCHLAPMVQDGFHGPERKKSAGRPKYRLVDETLNQEIDLSSMYCITVKSRSLKRCIDADKEEWDIVDDGGAESSLSTTTQSESSSAVVAARRTRTIRKQPIRARSAIKPMAGKIAVVRANNNNNNEQENKGRASPARAARSSTPRLANVAPGTITPTKKRKRTDAETPNTMDPARKRRASPRMRQGVL